MGKIYEALKKAEERGGRAAVAVETEIEAEPVSDFDFMRYSLGARSIREMDRANREAAATAVVRRETTMPVREVSLDPRRIDPHLVAFYATNPRASDQFNKLAITLISRAVERPIKKVLVTSAEHGEGRTCATLNLACALARAKQRVLVVDCDLLNPSAAHLLGIDCEIGLAEAHSRGLSAGEAALRVQPYGFTLLPTRAKVENPTEMLASPLFWKMLQGFEPFYDFILFDSSPLLATGDAHLLGRVTDTALLVIRAGRTSAAQLAKAIVPFRQEDIFGVVLNRVN